MWIVRMYGSVEVWMCGCVKKKLPVVVAVGRNGRGFGHFRRLRRHAFVAATVQAGVVAAHGLRAQLDLGGVWLQPSPDAGVAHCTDIDGQIRRDA